MDPIRNPYTPGAGTRPAELVGRDAELAIMDIATQRLASGRPARSVMLSGLRGVGKTVLLQEFGEVAMGHGWLHFSLEAREGLPFEKTMSDLVRRAMLRLSVGVRAKERARRALSVLASFQVRWKIEDTGTFELGVDPTVGRADSGDIEEDLSDLFEELGELVRESTTSGILFTIDEIQHLNTRQLGALIVALHRVAQRRYPLLVAGGGLPSIAALAGEAKSYAERLFQFRSIGALDQRDAEEAVRAPAMAEGVEWAPDALTKLLDASGGYPFFLQAFGEMVWNVAQGDNLIEIDDFEAGLILAIDDLDTGFFAVRVERTTNSERQYLKAMAGLGSGPYGSGSVAKALGKSTSQMGPIREKLIDRGLCFSPRHGLIDFTVPMFDDYVRRRM